MKPKRALFGLFAVVHISQISISHGATLTWDSNAAAVPASYDGGGIWTTPNSFYNGTANVTWVNGSDIASFGNTASNPIGIPGAITFTAGVTAGGMIFNPYFGNAVKYNISGGTGGVLTLTGTPGIAVNTNGARPFAAINAILAGTAGYDVTTTTAGILEIGTQANTITGNVRLLNGSSFSIGGDSSIGGNGSGLVFSEASATLITRATTTVAAGRPISISAGNTGRFNSLSGATLTLAPTAGIAGIGSSLQKEGFGGLSLGSANGYTGQTRVRQGLLTLNFASGTAPANDIVNASSVLRLYGGSLSMTGKTLVTNTQTFAGTILDPGASALSSTIGANGFTVLNLGAITRNPGSTLDISAIVAGTSYTTTTTNTNGILGGSITVAGGDWAAVTGGNIGAFAGYQTGTDATTWVSADNVSLAADPTVPLANDSTINTLRLTAAANVAIPAGKTFTISAGGLLSTGAGASSISGGTLKGMASGGLVVAQNSTSALAISSVIGNNGGATALTKSGSGALALTGANTFSGNVYLNSGSLSADSDAALGSGATVTARAGTTLTLAGGSAIATTKNFIFDFGSDSFGATGLLGTATDVGNFNLNVSNTSGVTVSGAFNVTAGTLVKSGAGSLVLTNPGLNQLARLNSGMGVAVLAGSVTFDGGVASEWRVGQAEFQVGLGSDATKASAAKAVVSVNSGAVTVGSWTGVGRGNGTTNLDSTIAMSGGSWDTGNLSLGYSNGVVAFAAKPKLDLSGNSVFNVRDQSLISESGGSDATVNVAGTAQYYSRNNIKTSGGGAKATINLSGNAVMTSGNFVSFGAGGISVVNVADNATLNDPGDFNLADNDGSTSTLNITGGTVTGGTVYVAKGSNVVGDIVTRGAVNQSGGTFSAGAGGDWRIGGLAVELQTTLRTTAATSSAAARSIPRATIYRSASPARESSIFPAPGPMSQPAAIRM